MEAVVLVAQTLALEERETHAHQRDNGGEANASRHVQLSRRDYAILYRIAVGKTSKGLAGE